MGEEYVPFQHVPMMDAADGTATTPLAAAPRSAAAWALAAMPLGVLAFLALIMALQVGTISWPIIGGVALAASGLSVILARVDQRRLGELGFVQRTNPGLAVVTLVYLFVRGNRAYRESFQGFGPAWVGLCVAVFASYQALVGLPIAVAVGQGLQAAMAYWQR